MLSLAFTVWPCRLWKHAKATLPLLINASAVQVRYRPPFVKSILLAPFFDPILEQHRRSPTDQHRWSGVAPEIYHPPTGFRFGRRGGSPWHPSAARDGSTFPKTKPTWTGSNRGSRGPASLSDYVSLGDFDSGHRVTCRLRFREFSLGRVDQQGFLHHVPKQFPGQRH